MCGQMHLGLASDKRELPSHSSGSCNRGDSGSAGSGYSGGDYLLCQEEKEQTEGKTRWHRDETGGHRKTIDI